ncbi:MAG TPA: GAF and ANTAR domain-containing protein [Mycobacteriales bacterium]|nr:GAF and ANTAR domain-containing protein [Mycobacteriales bacterium]
MRAAALYDEVIDAALSCAATLLDMEVVFIGTIDEAAYRFERVAGTWPGIAEGFAIDFSATFCRRMLDGAAPSTSDAGRDPAYLDTPAHHKFGVMSYVGVPIRDVEGHVIGTLCGVDHGCVEVDDHVIGVLTELAGIVAAHLAAVPEQGAVSVRRTPHGWAVGDTEHESSLTSAMVLADLLADDLALTGRPERTAGELSEVERLRASVVQLEHALAARVVVEQAIGVLAERVSAPPREAFEILRKVARRGGTRVHDLARQVVQSVTDPTTELPPELAR